MNLWEARHTAAKRLERAGIEDPDLEAEVLLRHILHRDRAAFFAHEDEDLDPPTADAFTALLNRRLAHEPLAYITGSREFYGLDFHVTPAALIPRPETEMLVEATLARLSAMRTEAGPAHAIDVGSGCGAVAIAVAANRPGARVLATDVSAPALLLTQENASRHGVAARIDLLETDLLRGVRGQIAVIAANPPYVRSDEWERLPAEIREHEPRVALDGGPDGLEVIRRLLSQAQPLIEAGAALYAEIGDGQGKAALAAARPLFRAFADIGIRRDLAGRERMLCVEPRG
ncbi:MAG TPA: peptide chain release factor N(5)-glutamine methyltransferase [Dehalococcoidia bacterium]|nr:peptide chain release factor N(5)-glutamine methyltransferase [Dehalococcoidia bacterium]